MTILVAPEHLWRNGRLQPSLAVEIDGAAVRAVRPLAPGETPDLRPFLAMPACTDLQVNGSGGTMLNGDPTPEGIARIVEVQRQRGTGWVMPTLITADDAVMGRAVEAALDAWGLPGFLGLHLEGPHLNRHAGARTTRRCSARLATARWVSSDACAPAPSP